MSKRHGRKEKGLPLKSQLALYKKEETKTKQSQTSQTAR